MVRGSINLEDQMENNYLSRGVVGAEMVIFCGFRQRKEVLTPAAGGAIFRTSVLPPFRALCGEMRPENGLSVRKSIFSCSLSGIWGSQCG